MSKNIELSAVEATSYWWTKTIIQKVREILIKKTCSQNERRFAEIFINYTERDWRKLYLELNKYIIENVNNYIPQEIIGIDCYNQDTAQNQHNDINRALSKITNKNIPDIRLASYYRKDTVIYTNIFEASIWYKSCGTTNLPTQYDPDYIITGDEKQLYLNNLFLATVAKIQEIDNDFNSISLLQKNFCKTIGSKKNLEKDKTQIEERFYIAWKNANDKDIILGSIYDETYSAHFHKFDFKEIEAYIEEAQHYADIILKSAKFKKKIKSKQINQS